MTDDRIRELAAKHAAYADSTLTLRGDAVVAFARDVIQQYDLEEFTRKVKLHHAAQAVFKAQDVFEQECREAGAWYAKQVKRV